MHVAVKRGRRKTSIIRGPLDVPVRTCLRPVVIFMVFLLLLLLLLCFAEARKLAE